MNCTVIDFETVNEKKTSACSIGLVYLKNNKIVEKIHYLIKPRDQVFLPYHTKLHGITEEMVENEPYFSDIWAKIKPYFIDSIVVAHNVEFDIQVLRANLIENNIEIPELQYICSIDIAKKTWANLEKYGLKYLSEYFEIDFQHHNALEDARLSTEIVLKAFKKSKFKKLSDFLLSFEKLKKLSVIKI